MERLPNPSAPSSPEGERLSSVDDELAALDDVAVVVAPELSVVVAELCEGLPGQASAEDARVLASWLKGLLAGALVRHGSEEPAPEATPHPWTRLSAAEVAGAGAVLRDRLERLALRLWPADAGQAARGARALGHRLDRALASLLARHDEGDRFIAEVRRDVECTTEEIVDIVRSALGVILSSSYLLERTAPQGAAAEQVRRHHRRIGEQVARADEAVGRLLQAVRRSPPATVSARLAPGNGHRLTPPSGGCEQPGFGPR
jgi:hypothetical protein